MRGYDRDDIEEYDEDEGEKQDGQDEVGEGEGEERKTTEEELEYLELRRRLKEGYRKNTKKELGRASAQEKKNRLPYDKCFIGMGSEQGELNSELKEKVFQIFKDFMARLAKLEELGTAASKFLTGFQQGLEFLRRSPMDRTSELIENIVKANETRRVKSYFEAGCVNVHDSVQNMSKSKDTLTELQSLLEDVSFAIQTANECLPPIRDKDFSNVLDQEDTYDKEVITSSDLQEPKIMEIGALMGTVYSMVKQDYVMQERIVTSLSLKTLSGELESYCLMWSLRPYINDEITHQAWKLIPQ